MTLAGERVREALVGSGAMPPASDPDLLVLLGLRLRSFAPAPVIADSVGLAAPEAESRLEALASADLARFRDGRMTGWMLTPAGRGDGERRLAAELDASGAREAVTGAYRRFLAINQRMLDTCTDWQLRSVDGEQQVNDHTDPGHDAAVVDRLVALDVAVQPIVADLAETLGRFGGYGPRLAAALVKVQGGDVDWFTKPTIDSYHTVWFELHENLLATLGIERSSESITPGEEAS
jgi:hypothetical protein